jgi:hypothetical protein
VFGVFLLSAGAALIAPPAHALPVATLGTGGCITGATGAVQTCRQTGGAGDIFSEADLNSLSATANLDVGPMRSRRRPR